MLDLSNPKTRQDILQERLTLGSPLVSLTLADELRTSVDTIRRDLIALERRGLLQRVRGGAIPVTRSSPPYAKRIIAPEPGIERLAERAVLFIPEDGTIFLDAGTTMNAIAAHLPKDFSGLIVTPAPSVALMALHRGVRVHLVGGVLCADGVMATGGATELAMHNFAADLCILGACGLWADFGLSAEDASEAGVKRAMALAAPRVMVVTSGSKLERRGRHHVLALNEINTLVTDASSTEMAIFHDAGIDVYIV